MGVEGIILSELIGDFLLIIITAPYIFKNSSLSFRFDIFIEMFKYGFPLIFSTTFAFMLTLGDRYIIKFLLGNESVGIYSLGHKIASVLNVFVIQSFGLGYLPIAFKKFETPNSKRFYSKVMTYFILVLAVGSLFLSLFGRELIETFASRPEYWSAYTVIPLICFAFIFKGMQYIFAMVFHFTKRTSFNAYIVFASAVLNVVLNFSLIPVYGYMGAAVSLLITLVVQAVFSYIFAEKLYSIKYEIGKLVKLILLSTAFIFISLQFEELSMVLSITLKLFLIIIFPVLLYFLNFFEPVELEKVKDYLKQSIKFRLKK
jgi:O-antigen/teichoic acid export membrane protein